MDISKILIDLGVDANIATQCKDAITGELYKGFIPKGQYNKKVEEYKMLEEKMKGLEDNSNQDRSAETNQVENQLLKDLLAKFEKFEKEREVANFNARKDQVKSELIEKGMNEQMVDLILKNNNLEGSNDDVINSIVTEYKDFIPKTEIKSPKPSGSSKVNSGGDTYSKDDLARMSEDDINALIEKDPNFFEKITY